MRHYLIMIWNPKESFLGNVFVLSSQETESRKILQKNYNYFCVSSLGESILCRLDYISMNPFSIDKVISCSDFFQPRHGPIEIRGRTVLYPRSISVAFGKLVDNFSHESDVTSLQDPFTSRPLKSASSYFMRNTIVKVERGLLA